MNLYTVNSGTTLLGHSRVSYVSRFCVCVVDTGAVDALDFKVGLYKRSWCYAELSTNSLFCFATSEG